MKRLIIFRDDLGNLIEFVKIPARKCIYNFSHRVTINGVARDWLSSDSKPNLKSAKFFAEKFCGSAVK